MDRKRVDIDNGSFVKLEDIPKQIKSEGKASSRSNFKNKDATKIKTDDDEPVALKDSDNREVVDLLNEFTAMLQNVTIEYDDDDDDLNVDFVDAKSDSDKLITSELSANNDDSHTDDIFITADLFMFDPIEERFTLQSFNSKVVISQQEEYVYWFSIESDDIRLGTKVDNNINPSFDITNPSFVFNYSFGNITLSYMLKFKSKSAYNNFKSKWSKIYWVALNKQHWSKVSETEKKYIIDSSLALERELDDILDTSNDERCSKEDDDEEEYDDDDDDDDEDDDDKKPFKRLVYAEIFGESESQRIKSSGNKSLTVAFKGNRSYVVRDDRIGVFKTGSDDTGSDVEFVTLIKDIKSSGGSRLDPSSPMLYMEDSSMVFKSSQENKLYKMDLNRGEVIEEWGVGNNNLVQYGPTKKFDQLTAEQTLIGLSNKSLFKLDPRINFKNKVVQEEYKEYATKNNFSSLDTTEAGYVAVGSEKGDIRLFDRLGIRAKTAIPSLGEPIRHICTSSDGKLLLATCDTSLLLMELTVKTGKNSGSIGFLKSFPLNENVKTHILRLKPENTMYMTTYTKTPVKFSQAYFNTGIDQQEQTIITSTGPFAISWSLDKVLKGIDDVYTIKRYDSQIVENNFEFGSNRNMIVALKDDVSMARMKTFRKPSKEVLFPNVTKKDFYSSY